jgi:hypothetical protein
MDIYEAKEMMVLTWICGRWQAETGCWSSGERGDKSTGGRRPGARKQAVARGLLRHVAQASGHRTLAKQSKEAVLRHGLAEQESLSDVAPEPL